ncbi:MAG: hypothetical protein K0B08_01285 [Bacteroidales bacterium]|nr:hypothetical protein [Bacteroidales bacterium]
MSDKISKIIQWGLIVLLALSAIFGLLFYTNTAAYTNLLLFWGYALILVTVVATVLAALLNIFSNPKKAIRFFIMLGMIAVIAVIAFLLSGNEYTATQLVKLKITETTSRVVGAGLIITYLLGIVALLSIVYATISSIFK